MYGILQQKILKKWSYLIEH